MFAHPQKERPRSECCQTRALRTQPGPISDIRFIHAKGAALPRIDDAGKQNRSSIPMRKAYLAIAGAGFRRYF
jgi:hypothetical protein